MPCSFKGQDFNNEQNHNNISKNKSQDIYSFFREIKIDDKLLKGKKKNCLICKREYLFGENVFRLPCNHYFHIDCTKFWVNKNHNCPMCRFELTLGNIMKIKENL